ncbi:hypothetical protein EDM57_04680 [Brevibacillus gelatini]|uniref:Uncharacterized protein n=1 Tax=Brevibacillus gelatini TaxID=1655277 RepID=A0A3M8B7K9_9BACL|nr:hypothetical protein [Brevibacillus gelatini]RNB59441.1 hypothetical protein EDM57_04680 [Brevibacillus gelatini]
MPVTENGYEYQMPDGIRNQLTKELLIDFHNNLVKIFKPTEYIDYINFYIYIESTFGWDEAFKEACKVHNKEWLYEYSRHLPWYEHDLFCDDVGELMVQLEVIEEGEPLELEDVYEEEIE